MSNPASTVARFRLETQDSEGRIHILEVTDASETGAIRRTVARGMRVLSIESASASSTSAPGATGDAFPLLLFNQELLALLEAGLNLTEALGTLLAKERKASVRRVLEDMLHALREGRSFSDVLAGTPQHFPEVYVATVRATERTGDLPQALARYIAYEIQFEAIRKKVVSASIYPAMLLTVGGFVTLFLLGYVVPRFSAVYESSGREMPWMSSMMIGFGKFVYGHWQIALVVVLTVVTVLAWGVLRAQGRAWLLAQALRLPWLAQRADEFRIGRFYRAVGLLLSAGIALPRAMGMVTGLLSSGQQARLAGCRQAIEQGQSLSTALVAASLASPVAESLIKVGERSGQMADMLERTARFLDEDLTRRIDWASRLLEPLLMTGIGLVIGTVVVLMYMPIFELAGSLQ